jgi:lysozyme
MSSKWKWCLEKDDETLQAGWVRIGDYWYYLKTNGTMAIGWIKHTDDQWYYLDDGTGRMVTGWKKINDKWYYLKSDGSMAANTTIDGYKLDINGVWQENILSDAGADYIGRWEGFWERAKYDPCYPGVDKYITIGYGTTVEARPDAFPNGIDSTCTKEQAMKWVIEEGQEKAETVKNDLDSRNITLNQNEMDALISFSYNCGAGSLLSSTLYKNIINGIRDADTITSNFLAWNKANGKVEPGLTRRRQSEANLFLNADYTGNN